MKVKALFYVTILCFSVCNIIVIKYENYFN